MPYEFYKILHITGILLLFTGLASVLALKVAGQEIIGKSKVFAFATHGLGAILILISGFGLLARLGMARNMPNWVYAKLIIWLLLSLGISLAKRKGQIGWPLYILFLGLAITAATMAVTKPF